MKQDVNYKIAALIYRAQIASDAGKGIFPERDFVHMDRSAVRYDYAIKVDCIVDAIKLIRSTKSEFNYFVYATKYCDPPIAYFEFRLNGVRKQISFHTPWGLAAPLKPYFNTGRKTRWNKDYGGSRRAAEELKEFYGLK